MFDSMLLGRYIPGDSIIHRLDARAKLIATALFMVIVFFANNLVTYLLLIGFVLVILKLAKLGVMFVLNGLKIILVLLVFTFLMHLFLTKGGPVLVDAKIFTIELEGVIKGLYISTRLIMLVVITTIMTLTTSPISLTDALEKLASPLKVFKVPVHEIAMMTSISLRFIPTLMDETDKIIKAQSSRGSTFMTGPVKNRIKALIPIVIPLFISAFQRAEDMAIAMEVRGYKGDEGRTHYRLLIWHRRDTIALIILVIFGVLLWMLRT